MGINEFKWQDTCCAWHGEYAEHTTPNGTILRLKRGPSVDGYLVMVFKNNQCQTIDDNGIPEYENITEVELIGLMEQ